MKYEREATTKNGRRTWKVTYELVRGPEPKPKRQADQAKQPDQAERQTNKTERPADKLKPSAAAPSAKEKAAKKAPPATSEPRPPASKLPRRRRTKNNGSQLGMF